MLSEMGHRLVFSAILSLGLEVFAQQAPPAPAAEAAPAPAAPAAAADLGGLPRIDPNNLPAGIGPVERGRLKKLAVFQERGQAPPADLVANLKPILDQMGQG